MNTAVMNLNKQRVIKQRAILIIVSLLFFAAGAVFQTPVAMAIDADSLSDPVLQIRFVAISKELRCLVCQNQSIYDSNAELAQDLRRQVREMLEDGRADDEIYRYMIDRYGDYVRYRPPWRINTLLLQLFPVFIALFGFSMLFGTLRRHRGNGTKHETQTSVDADSSSNSRQTDQL